MVLPRPTAFRTLFTAQQSSRIAGARAASRVWQQSSRRTYAHEAPKKSSDIPWLIGALAVTVPGASFLLSQSPQKASGSHGHGHEHAVEEHAKEEEQPVEPAPAEPQAASEIATKKLPDDEPARGVESEPETPSQKTTASESVKAAESEAEPVVKTEEPASTEESKPADTTEESAK
ncbi:hypothetical protein FQN50_009899 [Emmonsiellopsis sp. PD_5]|nr:hypothetical protein FQN50_009899 [Emmonsiellopsis sp. PD_5]